jgi:hypothetical protein
MKYDINIRGSQFTVSASMYRILVNGDSLVGDLHFDSEK